MRLTFFIGLAKLPRYFPQFNTGNIHNITMFTLQIHYCDLLLRVDKEKGLEEHVRNAKAVPSPFKSIEVFILLLHI